MLLGAQFLPYRARDGGCCCCLLLSLLPLLAAIVCGHVANNSNSNISSVPLPLASSSDPNLVLVNKCCEKFEIHVNNSCQQVNETGKWRLLGYPLWLGDWLATNKVNNLCSIGCPRQRAGTRSLAWSFNLDFIDFSASCCMQHVFVGGIVLAFNVKVWEIKKSHSHLFKENKYVYKFKTHQGRMSRLSGDSWKFSWLQIGLMELKCFHTLLYYSWFISRSHFLPLFIVHFYSSQLQTISSPCLPATVEIRIDLWSTLSSSSVCRTVAPSKCGLCCIMRG